MIKLYGARSLLYRRQILQENIRWKALDEIYKMYMFLHRSDLDTSAKFSSNFEFFGKFLQSSVLFEEFSSNFAQFILMKISRNYAAAFQLLLFSVPMFPFSYHSFQTDPQAKYL